MSTHRLPQVNELIRQELSRIILKEITLPAGCLATITKVDTSRDLSQSKIYLSVLPTEKQAEVFGLLRSKTKWLQHELGKLLTMYKIPKIFFIIDQDQQKIARIDELIDKIHQED